MLIRLALHFDPVTADATPPTAIYRGVICLILGVGARSYPIHNHWKVND